MKQQIEVLGRLASLRGSKVQQMLGRVSYQPVSYTHLDVYKRQG